METSHIILLIQINIGWCYHKSANMFKHIKMFDSGANELKCSIVIFIT